MRRGATRSFMAHSCGSDDDWEPQVDTGTFCGTMRGGAVQLRRTHKPCSWWVHSKSGLVWETHSVLTDVGRLPGRVRMQKALAPRFHETA